MRDKLHRVHKYGLVKWGKNKTLIMRCFLPNCSHYVALSFALGRMSLCWGCLEPILLGQNDMKKKKPLCAECIPKFFGHVVKKKDKNIAAEKAVDSVLDELNLTLPEERKIG